MIQPPESARASARVRAGLRRSGLRNLAISSALMAAGLAAGTAGLGVVFGRAPVFVVAPQPGPNVNMVSGTTLPDGDPYLQRQNEVSGGVSTRNAEHLLAGANDYRTVDIPGLPDGEEANGDAWLGVFKSYDGGQTWRSTLIPGYPQDQTTVGKASPIHGFQAGADPVVRAGTNGLFYYAGLAFNRGSKGLGTLFMTRFIDNNNLPGGDPIAMIDTKVLVRGTPGQFVDKPVMSVDVPRAGAGNCTINAPGAAAQNFAAGNVYVAYMSFTGSKDNHSKLMFMRSTNCGVTWTAPSNVSNRAHLNNGAAMAIDPTSGAVYVAFREFADNNSADAIIVIKSTDGGLTFSKGTTIASASATYAMFDQGGTTTTFRTNAYPTIAVDNTGRVYVAWAERGRGPASPPWPGVTLPRGDSRIVMATSKDGVTWTNRQVIEDESGRVDKPRGHQIMPAMTIVGGKISVTFYDFRDDVSGVYQLYISDYAGIPKRHTMDLRIIQGEFGDVPQFGPSVIVSQYLTGYRPGSTVKEQLQFNAPNLPLYSQGTKAFIGDYNDLGGLGMIRDALGNWKHNVAAGGPNAVHAFWTDNRDVRPPKNGDWTQYTPPGLACAPGQAGMRNANIYTSRITQGLLVGSPANTKTLGDVQKAFVVFAQNGTNVKRRYRFDIVNQPAGGKASFLQFARPDRPDPLISLEVEIARRSTASRNVYVTSSDPKAQVTVTVTEIQDAGGPPSQGLQGKVVLNPDVTNPDVTNSDFFNPDVTNPDVTNPDVTNNGVINSNHSNPDVTNPDVTNIRVANPDVTNPDVTNPDVTNPDVTNPDVTNPDVTNPDVTNPNIADVTWTVKNNGNTAGSFAVKPFLVKNAPPGFYKQLILHKIYKTPVTNSGGCSLKTQTQNVLLSNVTNPDVTNNGTTNPDVTNPDVTNASVWLDAGQEAKITLRFTNPDETTFPTEEITIPQPDGSSRQVDLTKGFHENQLSSSTATPPGSGNTPPTTVAALVIATTSLSDGVATLSYSSTLGATGGVGARTWSIVPNTITGAQTYLPDGLFLNPSTGNVYGYPTTAGSFLFSVKVVDSDVPAHSTVQDDVSIRIAPFAVAQSPTVLEDPAVPLPILLTALGGNNATFTFNAVSGPAHGALSGTAPNLTYMPATNYYGGPDLFTFTASLLTPLGLVTSPPATVSITVTPVNDVPGFTKGSDQTVNEDGGAINVPGFATAISAGPANETNGACDPFSLAVCSQTVDFIVSNNNNALFLVQPAIAPNGTLSYALAPNAFGSATVTVQIHDSGGTAGGGVNTSAAQEFTITVQSVNDAPSFTIAADPPAVGEDAGDQSVPAFATNISVGPANELTEEHQTLSFVVTGNTNAGLFAVPPAISPTGTLTYTSAANANGAATITVHALDSGPGTFPDVNTSANQQFTITVDAVNDPPGFATGGGSLDRTVDEDAGPQTVPAWATAITAGPGETQTLSFLVANDNNSLFTVSGQPAVDPLTGNLTYTPEADAYGIAHVTVTLRDNGGGADTSAPVNFTITVNAVNDAPSFTKGGDQVAIEDAGPRTVTNWATNISTGPANESSQSVNFLVSADTPALFTVPPAIDASGTLTYTPAPDANGSSVVTVRLHDNGGLDDGGVDTSEPQQFTITVIAHQGEPQLVPIVTEASDLPLSNHLGVPAGGVVNQSGDYAFIGNQGSAVFYRGAASVAATRVLQFADAIPNLAGTRLSSIATPLLNSSGVLALDVEFTTADGLLTDAILTYDGTTLRTIVSGLDEAPGTGGARFERSLNLNGFNDAGDLLISSSLVPGTSTAPAQPTLFFIPAGGNAGSAVRIAGPGALAGLGITLSSAVSVGASSLNSSGEVLFAGTITSGAPAGAGLFVWNLATGPRTVVKPGDSLPSPAFPAGTFPSVGTGFFNDVGHVTFVASGSIFLHSTAGMTVAVKAGSTAPVGGTFSLTSTPVIAAFNGLDTIAFTDSVTTPTSPAGATFGLFRFQSGVGVDAVAYVTLAAPGLVAQTLQSFTAISMNAGGAVTFRGDNSNSLPLGVFQRPVGGALSGVVLLGQATPLGGTFYANGVRTQTLNSGAVYFVSDLPDAPADYGEFLWSGGVSSVLMSTADTLPAGARILLAERVFGIDAAGDYVAYIAHRAAGGWSEVVHHLSQFSDDVVLTDGDVSASIPGGRLRLSNIDAVHVNANGQVVMLVGLIGGTSPRRNAIMIGSPTTGLLKVMVGGDTDSATRTLTSPVINGLSPSPMNDAGQVVFQATINANTITQTSGLWVGSTAGAAVKLALPGDHVGSAVGPTFTSVTPVTTLTPAINASGQVVFGASTAAGAGLFTGTAGGFPTKVVSVEDTAPGGGMFSGFDSPSFNNSGEVAFVATISGGGGGIFLFNPSTSTLTTLALNGTAAPAGGNFSITTLSPDVVINDQHDVVFLANLTGGSADSGYFIRRGAAGAVQTLVLQGDAAPGTAGVFATWPHTLNQFVYEFNQLGDAGDVSVSGRWVTGGVFSGFSTWHVKSNGAIEPLLLRGLPVEALDGGIAVFHSQISRWASGDRYPLSVGVSSSGFTNSILLFGPSIDAATPAGTNVAVTPMDGTSHLSPVTVTFDHVVTPGTTSLAIMAGITPSLPAGYLPGTPALAGTVRTTAAFTGMVTVCIDVGGTVFPPGSARVVALLGGTWVDVTSGGSGTVHCGRVGVLTTMAVVVHVPAPDLQADDGAMRLIRAAPAWFERRSVTWLPMR